MHIRIDCTSRAWSTDFLSSRDIKMFFRWGAFLPDWVIISESIEKRNRQIAVFCTRQKIPRTFWRARNSLQQVNHYLTTCTASILGKNVRNQRPMHRLHSRSERHAWGKRYASGLSIIDYFIYDLRDRCFLFRVLKAGRQGPAQVDRTPLNT